MRLVVTSEVAWNSRKCGLFLLKFELLVFVHSVPGFTNATEVK